MLGGFFGFLTGGDEAEVGGDKTLPLDAQPQDGDKASPLNASPASTATPGGGTAAGGAESPLTASPAKPLSGVRAPPGLDSEWQAVPPLPLASKDEAQKAPTPSWVRPVSLAEALQVEAKKVGEEARRDPASPVVSLADALPAPGTPEEFPTVGSRGHYLDMCKPCAFLHTKGCKNGKECPFCHLCERGAKKRRQRQRWQQKQVEYAYEQQAQVFSAAMAAAMPLPLLPFPVVPPALDATLLDPTLFYGLPTVASPYAGGGVIGSDLEVPMPVSLSDALAAPSA